MNLNEIEAEILRLQSLPVNMNNLEKLATLFVVRNNIKPEKEEEPEPILISKRQPRSELEEAIQNAPFDGVMDILEEHFEIIKAMYPSEYEAIIERIKEL